MPTRADLFELFLSHDDNDDGRPDKPLTHACVYVAMEHLLQWALGIYMITLSNNKWSDARIPTPQAVEINMSRHTHIYISTCCDRPSNDI